MTDNDLDDEGFRTVHATAPRDGADAGYVCQDPETARVVRATRARVQAWRDANQCPGCAAGTSAPEQHWPSCSNVNPLRHGPSLPDDFLVDEHLRGPVHAVTAMRTERLPPQLAENAALMAHPQMQVGGRVITDKRVSKVFRIWDWPRGTRDRGWGLLHDQIWFYDEPLKGVAFRSGHEGLDGSSEDIAPFYDCGKWWRRDNGRWLRLYMDRRMLWLPRWVSRLRLWNRFRLHRFHSGDDDSAPHDHPWGFVTFPFSSYTETVEGTVAQFNSAKARDRGGVFMLRDGYGMVGAGMVRWVQVVRRWRFHWRSALHRHFVHEPKRAFRTFVMARETVPPRRWGFWPEPDTFVPYDEWTEYQR